MHRDVHDNNPSFGAQPEEAVAIILKSMLPADKKESHDIIVNVCFQSEEVKLKYYNELFFANHYVSIIYNHECGPAPGKGGNVSGTYIMEAIHVLS